MPIYNVIDTCSSVSDGCSGTSVSCVYQVLFVMSKFFHHVTITITTSDNKKESVLCYVRFPKK